MTLLLLGQNLAKNTGMEPQIQRHDNRSVFGLKPDPFNSLAIFEATPNPYLILNTDFTIVAVNNAYLNATSTLREKIIGRGIFNVFPDNPNDPKATGVKNLKLSLERVVKTKRPDRMRLQKYDIQNSKGEFEEHYWSPLNSPVLNDQDELLYIIHHVEDVTETMKVKAEALELEATEARFRKIANAMPQNVWTTLPDGTVNWSNDWWYEYTGSSRGLNGIEWMSFIHPDDQQRVKKAKNEAIKKKSHYTIEKRLRNSKGEFRWHLSTVRPIRNDSGEIIEWVGLAIDIHELTQAREKLMENEARFRTITNAVPQIVWSTLPNGYHDYFNERYFEFTGVEQGSSCGQDWMDVLHPDDREQIGKTWGHSLATGDPYEIEYRLRHHSGEYRWVLGRALPVRRQDGKIVRWFGTCTDIHEHKQTLVALNDAIRDREMFLSIASHELKSPLTTLSLHTQMQLKKLKASGIRAISEESLQNTMEKIYQETLKLVKLVDEMLDVSRITSGKLTLELKPCNLCELLKDVLGRMTHQFQDAKIPVPQMEDCIEAWGDWDAMRIEQVITNLLTNAIRYGNRKPVQVRLVNMKSGVQFSVRDEGIGIPKEAQDTIFNRFERATNTSKAKGLGLGLFIAKEIVQAHGGKIWVESEPGLGSTFYVELPRPLR